MKLKIILCPLAWLSPVALSATGIQGFSSAKDYLNKVENSGIKPCY